MKVTPNNVIPVPRKLLAVVEVEGKGLFLRKEENGSVFISIDGVVYTHNSKPLERWIGQVDYHSSAERIPIYEGDEITIKF